MTVWDSYIAHTKKNNAFGLVHVALLFDTQKLFEACTYGINLHINLRLITSNLLGQLVHAIAHTSLGLVYTVL